MIEHVGASLAAEGLPYTPWLVLGGVPLKVYGALAFSLEQSLGSVLLWTLFASCTRSPGAGCSGSSGWPSTSSTSSG
jgi:hypothetical protein